MSITIQKKTYIKQTYIRNSDFDYINTPQYSIESHCSKLGKFPMNSINNDDLLLDHYFKISQLVPFLLDRIEA